MNQQTSRVKITSSFSIKLQITLRFIISEICFRPGGSRAVAEELDLEDFGV